MRIATFVCVKVCGASSPVTAPEGFRRKGPKGGDPVEAGGDPGDLLPPLDGVRPSLCNGTCVVGSPPTRSIAGNELLPRHKGGAGTRSTVSRKRKHGIGNLGFVPTK
jgi:hypothetical protein